MTWTYITKKHIFRMSHSGFIPGIAFFSQSDIYWDRQYVLWDRRHFKDDWPKETEFKKTIILHGHTPVQYLKFEYDYKGKKEDEITKEELEIKRQWYENGIIEWKPTIVRYCDGHKFDIDMGTIASKRIALLDLDTFHEFYFDEAGEQK